MKKVIRSWPRYSEKAYFNVNKNVSCEKKIFEGYFYKFSNKINNITK